MRSVFLPDSFAAAEQGGSWDLGTTALMIAGWAVVGLVIARAHLPLDAEGPLR